MKKIALYSSSRSSAAGRANPADPTNLQKTSEQPHQSPSGQPTGHSPRSGWRSFRERYERPLWVGAAALLALLVVLTHVVLNPPARQITQQDIESAVLHTLETAPFRRRRRRRTASFSLRLFACVGWNRTKKAARTWKKASAAES